MYQLCRNLIQLAIVIGTSWNLFSCKKELSSGLHSPIQSSERPRRQYDGVSKDLKWSIRFNLPHCEIPESPSPAYCSANDKVRAASVSGVEAQLKSYIQNPSVKNIKLTYFSFSNVAIRETLCQEVQKRDLQVTAYIHSQSMSSENVQELAKCAPDKIKVIPRGTTFGEENGYLLHSKIFLASESAIPELLSETSSISNAKIYFSSSSANLSSSGTSLHFENWLFFETTQSHFLAQQNLCFFDALDKMKSTMQGEDERAKFADAFATCSKAVKTAASKLTPSSVRDDIEFFAVPHGYKSPQPYKALRNIISGARSSLKMAIHRLTSSGIYKTLADRSAKIDHVSVIFDDDTLRTGKCNGGPMLSQGAFDVKSSRFLENSPAEVLYLDTNGSIRQLHHNKFVLADESILFQGAGNFTSSALNIYGLGNIEQYYTIKIPGIVNAYSRTWDYLKSIAKRSLIHETANLQDMPVIGTGIDQSLDDSQCS